MKENFSVKEILGAVDNILKIQSKNVDNELKLSKNFKKNTTTVDTTFQTKPITKSPIKIINEELIKKNESGKIINNFENKKDLIKDNKKKYDLMVINNAKDVLILNRIIFK